MGSGIKEKFIDIEAEPQWITNVYGGMYKRYYFFSGWTKFPNSSTIYEGGCCLIENNGRLEFGFIERNIDTTSPGFSPWCSIRLDYSMGGSTNTDVNSEYQFQMCNYNAVKVLYYMKGELKTWIDELQSSVTALPSMQIETIKELRISIAELEQESLKYFKNKNNV